MAGGAPFLLRVCAFVNPQALRRDLRQASPYVPNGDGDFSCLHLQRNHQLSRVFDLAAKLAPFVGPERDETLTEVPERDPDASPKDLRLAAV